MSEVDRILSAYYRDSDMAALVAEMVELDNLVQSLTTAAGIDCHYLKAEDDRPWKKVYDAVFSTNVSRRVFDLVRELNRELDYYDPDTSYEEDVRAFASALHQLVQELNE